MKRHIFGRLGRLVCFVAPAAAAVVIGFQVHSSAAPRAAAAPAPKPGVLPGAVTESMFTPGLKFHGSSDCKNADCHGLAKDKPKPAPKQPGNEHTLWAGEDPHNKAFESLTNARGKEIFDKYKPMDPAAGADAATSQKCTTCHALAAPANLRGTGFNVEEGVTCGSCHGPYEKWGKPHQKEGWTAAERTKAGGDPVKMWTTHAFYDTKSIQARADKCTSCHLAIDAKMVEAGHPQPTFELYYFSTESLYPDRHWKQEEGYFAAKLWAAGQMASLRDAMFQLQERASTAGVPDKAVKAAYDQAMSHYMVAAPLFTTNAIAGPPATVKALNDWGANLKASMAANKKDAVATAAKNIALSVVGLLPSVAKFEPNKATTTAVLQAVAAPDMATPLGDQGIEQQRGAVYALFASLTTSPDAKPANADAVNDLIISGMYPPEGKDKIDAASFNKGLAAVRAQLPK